MVGGEEGRKEGPKKVKKAVDWWTPEAVEAVRKMIVEEDMSYREIAERLGKTRSAIAGMANRWNLSSNALGINAKRHHGLEAKRKAEIRRLENKMAFNRNAMREMIKANPKLTGRLPIEKQNLPAFGSKGLPISELEKLKIEYRPKSQPRPALPSQKKRGTSKWG